MMPTLMHEAAAIGVHRLAGRGLLSIARVAELMPRFNRWGDPVLRDRLMRVHCSISVDRFNRARVEDRTVVVAGQTPGPEMPLVGLDDNQAALIDVVAGILGPRMTAEVGERDTPTYEWSSCWDPWAEDRRRR